MELREIRSLSLLAACGSIVETARQMNVTPAAVHKQLKHLADELQATLYEKRGNRLRLTAGAEILLPYFRDILTQQESSVVALEEWKGVRRGSVRIGSGPSLAANICLPSSTPLVRSGPASKWTFNQAAAHNISIPFKPARSILPSWLLVSWGKAHTPPLPLNLDSKLFSYLASLKCPNSARCLSWRASHL